MRDLRIDFLRGISLIIIFIDHFTATSIAFCDRQFFFPTLNAFGLCSAAEFFVFFSGYVFGAVYTRRLDMVGFWPCQWKAMARARHIFVVNFILFIAIFAITLLCINLPTRFIEYSDLWFLYTDFQAAIIKFMSFQYFPVYTDILPLYIIILLFSPMMLLLLRQRIRTALALSIALYVAAATIPELNVPLVSLHKDQWTFNPFSWQLIFVMGMAFGSKSVRIPLSSFGRRMALWGTGLVLTAIALFKIASKVGRMFEIPYLNTLGYLDALPGMDAQRIGIFRLAYFIALLFFITQIMPSSDALARMQLAKPVIACGEHSLEIFALTTLLCELGGLAMYEIDGKHGAYFFMVALGSLMLLAAGIMMQRPAPWRLRRLSRNTN